ncbi:hypothetical protein AGOR_G00143710 [Albula goreensis]|uniref:Uncharacterized protein n=1 Tax=Albula goreensis TaxID=1534307 RepID=A0A8T3D741_9TELE|nr:hypothetical protein AGOR_G00143710 [Albula goreensis]
MGAVLSWMLVQACALVTVTAVFSGLWSAQEALEDSANDNEHLEDEDRGRDTPEWGNQTQDSVDECCDSRAWHSDTFSDLCSDGEDCYSTTCRGGGASAVLPATPQGFGSEDTTEIRQLISELLGSLSDSIKEEGIQGRVPLTPPPSNPHGQVSADEGQKACPVSPCGDTDIIQSDGSGLVDSSALKSYASLGEERADAVLHPLGQECDRICLSVPWAQSTKSAHPPPESLESAFELSDRPVLHSIEKAHCTPGSQTGAFERSHVPVQSSTESVDHAPGSLTDASDLSDSPGLHNIANAQGLASSSLTYISLELSGVLHSSDCDLNASQTELKSDTGEVSIENTEPDSIKNTDPLRGDIVKNIASELKDIPVRSVEITLGNQSSLCEQSRLVQLELNRVSECLSKCQSDTNNNTKTSEKPCSSSPLTLPTVSIKEQSAVQVSGRSQDNEAAELVAVTPSPSALQDTLDGNIITLSTTAEVHNLPGTQDQGPSRHSVDCDELQGCKFDPSEVEELEKFHQQGVLDGNSVASQNPHTYSSILLPHADTSLGDCTEVSDVRTADRISNSLPNLRSSDPESSGDERLESLACYLESRGILLHTVEAGEEVRTAELLPETLGDCVLAEEQSDTIQISLKSLDKSVAIEGHPDPDAHLSVPPGKSLEPILESDYSQDNSFIVEEDNSEGEGKEKVTTGTEPCSEDRSSTPFCLDSFREDSSSVDSEQQLTSTHDPEDQKATTLLNGDMASERHRSPTVVSQDLDTTSTNSEETEDSSSFLGSTASLHKSSKAKGTKGSPTSKSSKFSVFSKMPSFRKGKAVVREGKGRKDSQDAAMERGEEVKDAALLYKLHTPFYRSHLSQNALQLKEVEQQGDNSDDEVFCKDDVLNQTVERAFGVSRLNHNGDEHGFCPSTPRTKHVQQLYQQSACDSGDTVSSPETPPPAEGLGYKRSKSSDSLSLRLRFAQAHKSLSSFFESRAADKENEEEEQPRSEGSRARTKHAHRKLKRAKEAELLKRALSVSDTDGANSGRGGDSPAWDSPSPQDSPASLRAMRHTDPLSKRAVLQDSAGDSPRESRSEGRRRRGLPNGLKVSCPSPDSSQPSSDESETPPPEESSSLSPTSPSASATLSGQLTPTWDIPLRPMSPKPQSPRPGGPRRSFRYPSSRASTMSLIMLGQGASAEGLSDPPEKPKTLKPRAAPLVSLNPPDMDCQRQDRVDGQSHISLVTSMSVNEFELSQEASKTASLDRRACDRGRRAVAEIGGSAILQRPRAVSNPCPGARQGAGRQRRCCSDDLWIEEEKSRKRKLARTARASLGRLSGQLPGEPEEARARLSLTTMEAFPSLPLKSHSFSHSTPIGLDCLGWRRRISFPSEYL